MRDLCAYLAQVKQVKFELKLKYGQSLFVTGCFHLRIYRYKFGCKELFGNIGSFVMFNPEMPIVVFSACRDMGTVKRICSN